jgi:serine/threonine protein kinase
MGKLFTITEGWENLGALKSGGQGSVYKGSRTGTIFTAVKLMPTPILPGEESGKHYTDFENEVKKLIAVNKHPNPNIVTILGSGITETGGFPFIEMEYIEGPDLCDLLKQPGREVFTVREVIQVAEQLSNALAQCHESGIRHGDIKSNNVKLNVHTGNYVLLDFGLAIMTDEERRTSLRKAGAVEFMAPEQAEGKMLVQSDVYSFGIVLYEILTGQVPFPLDRQTETARNTVLMAHMEQAIPDISQKRMQRLPEDWPEEKKESEMELPVWLTSMIYKCLEKDPQKRFQDGRELKDYILLNNALVEKKEEKIIAGAEDLEQELEEMTKERELLQQRLIRYQSEIDARDKEILVLNSRLRKEEDARLSSSVPVRRTGSVSRTAFMVLVFLTVVLGSLAAYALFFKEYPEDTSGPAIMPVDSTLVSEPVRKNSESRNAARKPEKKEEERSFIPDHNPDEGLVPEDGGDSSEKEIMSHPDTDTASVDTSDGPPDR